MLSTFNLLGKNIPQDKQMAMMRTYLSNLKDEIEAELYDVKWENLSKSLQDKINSLESYKDSSEERINSINAKYVDTTYLAANYATISSLNAATARIGSLEADHVSTGSFNAVVADIVNIKANYITASAVAATYATITNLNSVNAKFNNLDASKITSGTMNADRVDFSTGITTNMAVESTILIGFKRYNAGTSDYYLSINRNGITFHKRNNTMRLLDYTKMASL